MPDPRTHITPDAFSVSEELLGYPLASPLRRLAALLLDLAILGMITLVAGRIALILAAVVSVLFFIVAMKPAKSLKGAIGVTYRISVGCLGVLIFAVAAIVWVAMASDIAEPVGEIATFIEQTFELSEVETGQEAEAILLSLARQLQRTGNADTVEEAMEELRDLTASNVPWAGEADAVFARVDSILSLEFPAEEEEPAADPVPVEEEEPMPLDEAFRVYAAWTALPDSVRDDDDPELVRAQLRILSTVAADTLDSLENEVADLDDDLRSVRSRLSNASEENDRLEADLEEAQNAGLARYARDLIEELGFGSIWSAVYMALLLPLWNGRTVGKRIFGIQVLRLDGKPITWWIAFERFGGYAAGLATGLLGFAQIYWDPNRQAIHDKIVGTVVIREGLPKLRLHRTRPDPPLQP